MVEMKRPGDGLPPSFLIELIGKKLKSIGTCGDEDECYPATGLWQVGGAENLRIFSNFSSFLFSMSSCSYRSGKIVSLI